jgi:hypothetical protein
MEPVRFPDAQSELALKQYLHYELTRALSARQPLERQWRQWEEQYRAPAKQALKEFPFLGAANYVLPITATDVDQLYAKFMQSLHASPDLWIVQAMNQNWQEAAKPLQDFLSTLDRAVLKMWRVNKRAVLEMCKMGTAIYEHGWTFEQRPISTYDDDGKVVRMNRIRSQPFVDHVRLTDFLIPPYAYAIQPDDQGGAPWVAKRIETTREKLMALCEAQDPFLPDIGREKAKTIIAYERRFQQPYDDTIQKLDYDHQATQATQNFDTNALADGTTPGGVSGGYVRKIELWEFHVRWAMSGLAAPGVVPEEQANQNTDSPSDLVILWHQPTQTIVRAIYQPYLHGYRPFEVIRFFPGPGFYGIGLCEQLEVFQSMGSELHNWLYDNVLLGNSTMLAAQAGANVAPGEPIFPGKVFITDGPPGQAISALQMGSGNYPGLDNLIGMVDNDRNRRSGMSDLQAGNIGGLPGRTPATSVQALLAEGNRRPDLTLKDMRYEGLSTIGLRLIQLCQQFAASKVDVGGKRYLEMAVETLGLHAGQLAVEKLQTPLENAELGLGVEIAAASATQNKDMLRQQYTGLLTLVGQLYPQMIQMAQVAGQNAGSPVGGIATTALDGMGELLTRVLEQYDIRDTERMVPQSPAALPPGAGPAQGAIGAQPGPAGGGIGPLAPPGMAPLPPGYGNAPPGAG